jgi:hypothetical protein
LNSAQSRFNETAVTSNTAALRRSGLQ